MNSAFKLFEDHLKTCWRLLTDTECLETLLKDLIQNQEDSVLLTNLDRLTDKPNKVTP